MLDVHDLARAFAFWRDVMGFDGVSPGPELGELRLPGGGGDGPTLLLHYRAGEWETQDAGLVVHVADVFAALDAIKANGGSVAKEPEDRGFMWFSYAVDPDRNKFQLVQAKKT